MSVDIAVRIRLIDMNTYNSIIGFQEVLSKKFNRTSKIHLGPSSIEILQSITSSEDQFNLDKLEYLEDSFIYLSMVIKVIHELPNLL